MVLSGIFHVFSLVRDTNCVAISVVELALFDRHQLKKKGRLLSLNKVFS